MNGTAVPETSRTALPAWRLGDILRTADPSHTALISGSARLRHSYAELSCAADLLAAHLTSAGLHRGDVVALQSSNGPQFVVALIAAARAGMVVAPMAAALPVTDRRQWADVVGARVILTDRLRPWDFDTDCPDWLLVVDHTGLPIGLKSDAPARTALSSRAIPGDDALVLRAPRTGEPERWTHADLATSIAELVDGCRLSARDATVVTTPLCDRDGLVTSLLATLASGGTVLLSAGRRFTARTFWDDVAAAGATWYTVDPATRRILTDRAAPGGPDHGRDRPGLRHIDACAQELVH